MSLAKLINELNAQQKKAATTTAQNCLVLAGAGCGKTKTIVARAAYLIDQGLPANQIQILTFTRRAASEIVARLRNAGYLVGSSKSRPNGVYFIITAQEFWETVNTIKKSIQSQQATLCS